jgi:mRNA-degrading endonuclease toxin of MazEF toxin-antitoxin module
MDLDLKVGTVVRIRQFPFTDQVGAKTAPVVVLSSDQYHREREELIGARITSKLVHKDTFGTIDIHDPEACGLTEPSVIKPVVMTVLLSQIQRVTGRLDGETLHDLRRVFTQEIFAGLLQSGSP